MTNNTLHPEQILLVLKRTKWERDLQRYGSALTAKKIYWHQNQSFNRTFESHERQIKHIEWLRTELPKARFIYREELPFINNDEFELLISVGGDNHFVYVCRYAQDKPVMGVNSDDKTSTGALLSFTPAKCVELIKATTQNKQWHQSLEINQWTRIEGHINYPDGRSVNTGACISEISVRSKFHDYISRYLIRNNKEPYEEHKCSGLLLSTGAGSTGWYRNCHPTEMQKEIVFSKESLFFRGVAREPGFKLRSKSKMLYSETNENETLEVISEMDGEITLDADPEQIFEFTPGCVAYFKLSDQKLSVIESYK